MDPVVIRTIWLIMTAVCLIVSTGNLRDVYADLIYWRGRPLPDRDEAVGFDIKTDVAVEGLLIAVQVLFGSVVIMSFFAGTRPDYPVEWAAYLIAVASPMLFTLADVCLVFVSIIRARSRYIQKAYSRRRDRRAEDPRPDGGLHLDG